MVFGKCFLFAGVAASVVEWAGALKTVSETRQVLYPHGYADSVNFGPYDDRANMLGRDYLTYLAEANKTVVDNYVRTGDRSLYFDGISTHLHSGPDTFPLSTTGEDWEATVEMWVNFHHHDPIAWNYLWSTDELVTGQAAFIQAGFDKESRMHLSVGGDDLTTVKTFEEDVMQWHHWAFTLKTVSGNDDLVDRVIYRDGEVVAEDSSAYKLVTGSDKLRFGTAVPLEGPNSRVFFHGIMDEIRVFDVAVDQADINAHLATQELGHLGAHKDNLKLHLLAGYNGNSTDLPDSSNSTGTSEYEILGQTVEYKFGVASRVLNIKKFEIFRICDSDAASGYRTTTACKSNIQQKQFLICDGRLKDVVAESSSVYKDVPWRFVCDGTVWIQKW